MSTNVREELKAFERDLAHLVARFLRLYEHLEGQVRPESQNLPVAPTTVSAVTATPTKAPHAVTATLLPGYQ